MRVCLCERGKFATQALFSVQVMALESTNREVNMTAGDVLFLERACLIISSDCHMQEDYEQTRSFGFRTCFSSAHTTQAKPSSESHSSIYVPQAHENSLSSALHRAGAELIQ